MSAKIFWPESQQCVGCKHGCFLMNESESSVYVCDKGLNSPEESCYEPDISNIEELENEDLSEMREVFYERNSKSLPIDLGDFEELIIEIERRQEL